MSRVGLNRWVVLLSMVLSLRPVFAQVEQATATGIVSDTTGGVVPGVSVTIRNVKTNVATKTETNSSGIYYIPALLPGTYELLAEKAGFRPARITDIPLSVGLTATMNVTLDVGSVAEAVEVRATAVQLESQTAGVGKALETRRVIELPLLGRNPLQLVSLAPGVIPAATSAPPGGGVIGSVTSAKVAGGLAQQNGVLTDGAESRGTTVGSAYTVPLESVSEFRVETATYSAEFGRAGGGVVQVVTSPAPTACMVRRTSSFATTT